MKLVKKALSISLFAILLCSLCLSNGTYGLNGNDLALISRGARAEASSWGSYGGYDATPERAIDGNHERGWGGTQGVGDWIIVELSQTYPIKRIVIDNGYHTLRYRIDASKDGSAWREIVSPITSPGDHYIENELGNREIFDFSPAIEIRYLKLTVLETNAPSTHIWQAIIDEVEVYGDEKSGYPCYMVFTDRNGVKKSEFRIDEPIYVTVRDLDEDRDSGSTDSVRADIGVSGGNRQRIVLFETGSNTAVFRNTRDITPGSLGGQPDDTLYAEYTDPDDPSDRCSANARVWGEQPNRPPVAELSVFPTTAKVGQEVTFDASGSYDPDGSISSYYWTFGDGGTSSSPNPSHTYNSPGTYTATLEVTDDDGLTDSDSVTVRVEAAPNHPPTIVLDFPRGGEVLSGTVGIQYHGRDDDRDSLEVTIQLSDDGGRTWQTIKTSLHSTSPDFTEPNLPWDTTTFPDGDNYKMRAIADDGNGGTDTDTSGIFEIRNRINEPPRADFDWSPSSPKEGEEVSFTDRSDDPDGYITSWHWDFGDGATSTSQNPRHTYSSSGSYEVCLRVTDNEGASDTACKNISIGRQNQPPIANFSFSPQNPAVGETIQFTDRSADPDGYITSWSWDFGDGGSSSSQNPTHTYSSSGSYEICLTVRDNDGSSDTACKTLTSPPPEKPDLIIEDIWNEGSTIYYRIKNIGDAPAETTCISCFYSTLYVDGEEVSRDWPPDLAPGESSKQYFSDEWVCSKPSDRIKVIADAGDHFDESNEGNNATEETLSCGQKPQPELLDFGITKEESNVSTPGPLEADKGQRIRLWYQIKNPNDQNIEVGLGASIRDPSANVINDPSNDRAVTIQPGVHWASRYFDIPQDARSGEYDVAYGIWDKSFGQQYQVIWKEDWLKVTPVAKFTYKPSEPSVGEEVTFDPRESYDDPDGHIVKYEWDLDGDGTFEKRYSTDDLIKYSYLVEGKYNVCLKITDNNGLQDENCISIGVENVEGKKYALIIGYDTGLKKFLHTAENDAKMIKNLLEKNGYNTNLLVRSQATKRNIIDSLERFKDKAKNKNDKFVFYFAGHGGRDSIEVADGEFYDDSLFTHFSLFECTLIAIFQSCYSGSMLVDAVGSRDNTIAISSTSEDELMHEWTLPVNHTEFAKAFVEGFTSHKDKADANDNGKVSLEELYEYIYDRVSRGPLGEHPMILDHYPQVEDSEEELYLFDEYEPFALERAIDINGNNIIDDGEILSAVHLWISGDRVPNSDGKIIDDTKILELIQLWISGQPISSASTQMITPEGKPRNPPLASVLSSFASKPLPLIISQEASTSKVKPGESFELTVNIKANEDIAGLLLTEELPQGWTTTPIENAAAFFKKSENKWLWLNISSGKSRMLHFKVWVPEDAKPGIYEISGMIRNAVPELEMMLDPLNIEVEIGSVTLICEIAGSDKIISGSELIAAIQCYAAGEITGADLVTVIQYYATGTPCDQPLPGASAANELVTSMKLEVESIAVSPNPVGMSGTARARFVVKGTGIAGMKVEIFNLAGMEVFAQESTGNALEFHAVDNEGRPLANGVYLYVVTAYGYNSNILRSSVEKLVIIR